MEIKTILLLMAVLSFVGCSTNQVSSTEEVDVVLLEDNTPEQSPEYYEGYAEGVRELIRSNVFRSGDLTLVTPEFSSRDFSLGYSDGYEEVLEAMIDVVENAE